MDSIFVTGLKGVQIGLQGVADSASRISSAFRPDSSEDPVKAITDLNQSSFQVKASLKVIKTGDQLNGTLLDIFA